MMGGGGRWVKCGRPHQILIFAKEKYEFVYCQLCFLGFRWLQMIILARFIFIFGNLGPVIINDRLIIVGFLREGGGAQKFRRLHPHLGGGVLPKFC